MIFNKEIRKLEKEMKTFLEILHIFGQTEKEILKKIIKTTSKRFHYIEKILEKKKLIIKILKKTEEFRITNEGIEFLIEERKQDNQQKFNAIMALSITLTALLAIFTFLKQMEFQIPFWILIIPLLLMGFVLVPLIKFIAKISIELSS